MTGDDARLREPAEANVGDPQPPGPARSDQAEPTSPSTRRAQVRRTRASAWWAGLIIAALVAVVFLIFIVQNSEPVDVQFFAAEVELPLAVALLLAAVAGMLVIAAPGIARIIQLRRMVHKTRDR